MCWYTGRQDTQDTTALPCLASVLLTYVILFLLPRIATPHMLQRSWHTLITGVAPPEPQAWIISMKQVARRLLYSVHERELKPA